MLHVVVEFTVILTYFLARFLVGITAKFGAKIFFKRLVEKIN